MKEEDLEIRKGIPKPKMRTFQGYAKEIENKQTGLEEVRKGLQKGLNGVGERTQVKQSKTN